MLLACGPSNTRSTDGDGGVDSAIGDGAPQPHTLVGILVTPTNPLVELDLNTTGSQAFVATGTFLDGVPEDLSSQVTWSVNNAAVGTMTGPTLSIPAFTAATAEVSRITATMGSTVGEAQITIVAYRRTGPTQDFFFILPYQDPAGAARRPLDFATNIPSLDVFFLMDTTGSMFGSITNLQSALSSVVVPGIQAAVADSQFGVGAFEDFPTQGYGSLHGSDCGRGGLSTPDQPFHLFQPITSNIASVQTGVGQLRTATGPIGCGQDWPEAGMEALYQASTGAGLTGPAPTNVPANHTGVGGVAFRSDSMPVIVQITDAQSHGPGETGSCPTTGESANYTGAVAAVAHSRVQTKAAVGGICGRVVGVAAIQPTLAAQCSSQADLEDFATATGSLVPPEAWDVGTRPAGCAAGQCCTGANGVGRAPNAAGKCPVVFLASPDGSGLGNNIVTGIRMLTRFATFDVNSERVGVTTDIDGHPLPVSHTTADFLRAITPSGFVLPPPPPNLPNPTFDTVSFHQVTPGTKVSFNVDAFNDFVEQTDQAQIFRASIRVLAGSCTPLDEREVLILVPPMPVIIN
jgi:hypothetical protein